MANALLYYLIVINVVTFLVYGIDKAASKRGQSQTRLSYAERKQARPKVKWKAKKGSWRISEATLLILAAIGGSIGALLGMKICYLAPAGVQNEKESEFLWFLFALFQVSVLFNTSLPLLLPAHLGQRGIGMRLGIFFKRNAVFARLFHLRFALRVAATSLSRHRASPCLAGSRLFSLRHAQLPEHHPQRYHVRSEKIAPLSLTSLRLSPSAPDFRALPRAFLCRFP